MKYGKNAETKTGAPLAADGERSATGPTRTTGPRLATAVCAGSHARRDDLVSPELPMVSQSLFPVLESGSGR